MSAAEAITRPAQRPYLIDCSWPSILYVLRSPGIDKVSYRWNGAPKL